MITGKMLGMARLAAKVALLGPVRKRLLQAHFERRGNDLVDKIKAATPVDKGSLRASVRMVPKSKKPGVLIIAGGTPETARGPNLDEAMLTEYGTRRETAEPFFWPTIEGDKRSLTSDVAHGMKSDGGDDGQ